MTGTGLTFERSYLPILAGVIEGFTDVIASRIDLANGFLTMAKKYDDTEHWNAE